LRQFGAVQIIMGGFVSKFVKVLLLGGMLAAVGVVPADAQTIGFKIGPTFSKLDVEDADDDVLDNLTSFGGGGFIRFGMMGLALQAEVLAISKGYSVEDAIGDEDAELELTYVEIPVTAMFSLGRGPYLFAGPFVGIEVGCKGSIGGLSGDCDENDGERKETDFGLVGGAGFQIPLGPGSLLIEGRYSQGLTNLNDVETEGEIKSRYWGIFGGFSIPIGGR
jgi:hypothetical protein